MFFVVVTYCAVLCVDIVIKCCVINTMVSYRTVCAPTASSGIRSNYAHPLDGDQFTLGDWIGRVRTKRREMRRKNADLRVATVLTLTLRRAEADLRVRQLERATKWDELNQQISQAQTFAPASTTRSSIEPTPTQQQPNYYQQNHQQLIFNNTSIQQQQQQQHHLDPMEQEQQRITQQAADDEIWRNELSDLDQFIRNLSAIKTCVVR